MNTHSVDLDGYYARSCGNSTIYLGTAGSHGNEQLQVTQGDGWEGLTVQVVFHPSQVAVQLPANGVLDVPWEATEKPLTMMQGRIVFQGFDQGHLVNSTDLAYTVASHSPAVGRDEKPYTPRHRGGHPEPDDSRQKRYLAGCSTNRTGQGSSRRQR